MQCILAIFVVELSLDAFFRDYTLFEILWYVDKNAFL